MANQTGNFGYDRDLSGLFDVIVGLCKDYMLQYEDRDSKVIEFRSPSEISSLVDMSLPEEPVDEDRIVEQVKSVLKYSVHTNHPYCNNQLWSSGVDQVGLLGQFLTSTVHTLMYTFEMAPVFTVMEATILQRLRQMIGWSGGEGDGIFTPGGSIANLYGLMAARYHKYPETKEKGIQHLPRLVIFGSEQCHYSNQKSAIIMGIGTEAVIKVKCDPFGKMDPVDLDKQIEEAKTKGYAPFAVVATSGSTVIGAFDPIGPIADVCDKHNLWLHIDAAYGGGVLFSDNYRHLMANAHRSDSITWDLHKSATVPQQCSAILLKHKGLLAMCNSTKASYLFQRDKQNYDVSFDTGDKSIQCGRLNDVLKLWIMWKAKGKNGFAKQMDNSIGLAKYLAKRVKERDDFELILEPEYTNVCFWYIAPSVRGITDQNERKQKLNGIAPKIKARLMAAGTLMLGYQPLGEYPNFFRMVTTCPQGKEADMDFLLNEIKRLGKDL
ncbi:PREDICTED: glutamate decarboxylase 1-like [Amphimedon queenslandica]|uniref:Glutamate decarboxylase n=1 Tax=Amphimedon queenslandica TaxID=400682 RepID=A0A1X7TSD8_AMPQE|nr:PREDICTED: glutamate decarboxylase 1-like [Amphimedon queenslandica]|eukprot:XP_019857933.1 PREDICTED: glutamate decarboxylase 1-like [Amphimedon queenslandica]